MKTSVLHLGFILAAGAVAASAADELPAPKISDKNTAAVAPSPAVSDKIMAGLPKYDPTPAATPAAPAEPKPGDPVKPVTPEDIARTANPDNADLLVLPKIVVKQKPRPRLTPDAVLTKKDLGAEFAKQHYTQLDQALNKYTRCPFSAPRWRPAPTTTISARKNAQMKDDVNSLSKAVEASDPAEAKAPA
ncbi:MAG: hypothetical protein WDM96_07320 [Lacunisphaera sp.]